jgi:ribosomal protein S18 acetylase RimI-like enzyme
MGDRSSLIDCLLTAYREIFPHQQQFDHLVPTLDYYLSDRTPLRWVLHNGERIGCVWWGNAVEQVSGDRYVHIFLLYVAPTHRRRGIGTALMDLAQAWAAQEGYLKIGLQVFAENQAALSLYNRLGYQPQSVLMLKAIPQDSPVDLP